MASAATLLCLSLQYRRWAPLWGLARTGTGLRGHTADIEPATQLWIEARSRRWSINACDGMTELRLTIARHGDQPVTHSAVSLLSALLASCDPNCLFSMC